MKLNTYDFGVELEDTTASIFEKMGCSMQKRKRVPTKSGAIILGNQCKEVWRSHGYQNIL